ncbi:MAG: type II toxin-antitoxin system RelE/ParE family toxin [bacterium]
MKVIEIIETPIFTEDIDKFLGPNEYRALQLELIETPTKGKLIKGTGGARKLRFAIPGKGKSGGIRIIYYYQVNERIYLLLVYKKAKQADLTPKQRKTIKSLIERIK